MQTVAITTGRFTHFGSGEAWASFKLDGLRPDGVKLYTEDSFVRTETTLVPLRDILNAGVVEFSIGAIPGGKDSFKGSGRHFLKWFLKLNPAKSYHAADRRWESLRYKLRAHIAGRAAEFREIDGLRARVDSGEILAFRLNPVSQLYEVQKSRPEFDFRGRAWRMVKYWERA